MSRLLPNLEKISLDGHTFRNNDDLQILRELKCRKSLRLRWPPTSLQIFNKFVEANIPIESLNLCHTFDDVLRNRILSMESIRKLSLWTADDEYLQSLAMELPFLTKLSLYNDDNITVNGLKKFLFDAKNLMFLQLTNVKNIKKIHKSELKQFTNQRCGGKNVTIQISDF